MTKTLWESTTIISKRKNRFNKTRSDENWSLYKTQRKFCTKLSKKKYGRLFLSFLNPNYAIFWQTIKPQSLEKSNFYNKMIISEKRMHGFWRHITIWGFNKQFIDITKVFDLKQSIIPTTTSLPETINAFKDHPSIQKISLCKGTSVSSGLIFQVKIMFEIMFQIMLKGNLKHGWNNEWLRRILHFYTY